MAQTAFELFIVFFIVCSSFTMLILAVFVAWMLWKFKKIVTSISKDIEEASVRKVREHSDSQNRAVH